MSQPPLIRPMLEDDVAAAEALTDESFHAVDVAFPAAGGPPPARRTDADRRRWSERTRGTLRTDAGGCWVADVDGEVVGMVTSIRRDLTWILCSYAVRGSLQGQGVGRALLEAAGQHSQGCLRAMLSSSDDPRAVRRYLRAGFTLQPWMHLRGSVDRSAIPASSKVRVGSVGDIDLMDSLDRRVRDAAHGSDHAFLLAHHPLLVLDQPSGQGYVYVREAGGPTLLAATDRRTATRLLWESLALSSGEVTVAHVSAAQTWALDVSVEAGLSVFTSGYLALRGMKTPAPYLPHGALL